MADYPQARPILEAQGFPRLLLDAWERENVQALLPVQKSAVDAGALDDGSWLIIAPTSSGKTFVGELACVKRTLANRASLFLVPFRALADERYREFLSKYGAAGVGAEVLISTSDFRDTDKRLTNGDFHIAILTYEKLSALLVPNPSMLRNIGLLVVDEIQMIGDAGRGAELELLLTRVRQIAPDVPIIGLSAAVSDASGLDSWLGARVLTDGHRPVPLQEGVISPDGEFDFVEWSGSERANGSSSIGSLAGRDESDIAASLAAKLLNDPAEQLLVFAPTVAETSEMADKIARRADHLAPAARLTAELSAFEDTQSVSALMRCAQHSIGFHNAELTFSERSAVERSFRESELRCVVSTSTLAMGVNLPASSVVITKSKKWNRDATGWSESPISVAEYRNMSGRAGRYGLRTDDHGRSFLICKSPLARSALFSAYPSAVPEAISSAFGEQPLDAFLLRAFASGLCTTESGSARFLLRTFSARERWSSEAAQGALREDVEDAVERLVDGGLLARKSGERIETSPSGLICASSGLQIETFTDLVDAISGEPLTSTDVALVASRNEDTGPQFAGFRLSTAEYRQRTPSFVATIRDVAERLGGPLTDAMLDRMGDSLPSYEIARSLKFQAAAIAFVAGAASGEIENSVGVSSGRARSIGSTCSWLCDTAAKVCWATGRAEVAKDYENLAERFLAGCSAEALFLIRVPHQLHRAERELLVEAGYKTFRDLVNSSAEDVAKTARVSRAHVLSLQSGIVEALGESLELEKQQSARLHSLGIPTEAIESLYMATGPSLERAIEDLLSAPFCPLQFNRITTQRRGEADLRFVMSSGGIGIAQVTAKDDPTHEIGMTKAISVLVQSPELSPSSFICFGRPGFHEDAMMKCREHVANGVSFRLISIAVLAEMFVRFHEGRISSDQVAALLETAGGHIGVESLPG